MPLVSVKLNPRLQKQVEKKTNALCRSGLIDLPEKNVYRPGFCMLIQLIPQHQIAKLSFGTAEGIRVFIQSANQVAAAVDFYYAGEGIQLVQIYQGPALEELLKVLNRLEKRFVRHRSNIHAELLSFSLASGVFMLACSAHEKYFYTYVNSRLCSITPEKLQHQVDKIIATTKI